MVSNKANQKRKGSNMLYANKSNAKRATINSISKRQDVPVEWVKANLEALATIEVNKDGKFSAILKNELTGLVEAYKQPTKKAVHVVTGLKICKNRVEQNGVKQRSKGGKCSNVWEACDALLKAGTPPVPKQMREMAELQGWNENNTIIEMYKWRKFNGLSKSK